MLIASPKIHRAANALATGHVVAYPTEAVWGLGCDPFNRHAVEAVLALKNRPVHKGLILVAATIEQFDFLLWDLDAPLREKLQASWPGHTTWLVPHHDRLPKVVSGQHSTIAVRVSAHPGVRALCSVFGGPIVSTSANPQGFEPARTGFMARKYFRQSGVVFAPGVVGQQAKPSAIIDAQSGAIIR